ncbi:MAG: L,D-transpeptidase family protein [Eubacteriales bacterium]|nr:L,D-transpeptidase family protein [Eubacteriales bacterium]
MLKKTFIVLILLILLTNTVFAEGNILIRPGKTQSFGFEAPKEGTVSISLQDAQGALIGTLQNTLPVKAGENYFLWNGFTQSGDALKEGDYKLLIKQDNADIANFQINAGALSPMILSVQVSSAELVSGEEWQLSVSTNMQGRLLAKLNIEGTMQTVAEVSATAGENIISWDGRFNEQPLSSGMHMVAIVLQDETGFESAPHYVGVNISVPTTPVPQVPDVADPSAVSQNDSATVQVVPEFVVATDNLATAEPQKPKKAYRPPTLEMVSPQEIGSSYWTLPVGDMNEEAIWNVMMQPITVVKGIGKRPQVEMYRLRATPDKSMKNGNVLGEITCESQGVNVIKNLENGWSFVETYNSSYGPDCDARPGWGNSDELIRGYVETDRLEVINPKTEYGVLIDKLTQTMYVFKDGKIFTELLISTGKPTTKQPWNETPSGEYLMVSRVGGFYAGNLYCDMGMRINGGCLIHEVPYIENLSTGYHDYSTQEPLLGSKASHGCVRVQRKKNDDGINMTWLWNNIGLKTKVLVWDDMPSRFHEYPEDSLKLYYNPTGGQYYHLDDRCSSIRSRYLPLKGSFTYGELDDSEHQRFTPCERCKPPLRKAEIDELNRQNGF